MSKSKFKLFKKIPIENAELQKHLEGRITLLKETGDIEKIGTPIDSLAYKTNNKLYENLVNEIRSSNLPKEIRNNLSFELNKCQAIIAFRASEFDNHTKHLTRAYKDYNPGRDKSIIELGEWNTRYKSFSEDQQKKMSSISSLHSSLLTDLTTTVKAFIAQEKYDEAFAEMKGLQDSSNMLVVKLYASIHIARNDLNKKDLSEALKYCQARIQYEGTDETTKKAMYTFYNDLVDSFNTKGATAQANEATKTAKTYMAVHINQEIAKAQQEVKELQVKYAASLAKLGEVESNNETEKKRKELAEKNKMENDKIIAEITAEYQAKIDALTAKMSPTIESVVNATEILVATAPPPSYNDAAYQKQLLASLEKSNYLKIPYTENNRAGSVVPAGDLEDTTEDSTTSAAATSITTIVSNAAQEQIDEITQLLNSETPNMLRVDKVLWKQAIEKQPDLYNFVDDPKLLISLASYLLKNDKHAEAKAICDKIFNQLPNAYEHINDSEVLYLLADEIYYEQAMGLEYVNSYKKSFKLSKTPSIEKYNALKEFGKEITATDKQLAINTFNVAKDHATTLQQKIEISMSIMNTYCSLNKIDEAKKVYKELLNNTTYPTIYKDAKSPEEIALLFTIDDDLAKYKSYYVKFKNTPMTEYDSFYEGMKNSPKCELKVACLMEVNIIVHNDNVNKDINSIVNANPNNTTISQLFNCYNPHYSQTTTKETPETYVKAIGDVEQTLEHYLFGL